MTETVESGASPLDPLGEDAASPALGRPLEGVRVLDFTTVMAGPYCTRALAALGADVIKVESPDGDYTRGAAPMRGASSAYFAELNHGKRSIVLDLKQASARLAAQRLVATSDVLVENMRVGAMEKFGLGHTDLQSRQPGLIYCSITGFGQGSDQGARPATAQVIQALTGYDSAFQAYQPEGAPLPSAGLYAADGMAGALAVGGILAALRSRDQSGHGCHVDVALDSALMSMLTYEVQAAQFDPGFRREGYRPIRVRDGFVMVAAVTQRNFENLCAVLGRPDLLGDERFAAVADRWRHYPELHELIEAWSIPLCAEDCERQLLEKGVPAARYQTVRDYLGSESTADRLMGPAHDAAGTLNVTSLPFRISTGKVHGQCTARPSMVPALGEHTIEVLGQVMDSDQVRQLLAAGAAQASR